jgi:hypothetical protein
MKPLPCSCKSNSFVPSFRLAHGIVAAPLLGLLCLGGLAACGGSSNSNHAPFIGSLNTVSTVASTVPDNGDVNPYGTVVVPRSIGQLVEGDVLVSNFNNSANQQGTGSTIVQVAPNGTVQLFAQLDAANLPGPCPGGVGLTTALAVLRTGWVIVGSLPTSDGTSATAQAGCLIVLDQTGEAVETISTTSVNGPWDMTATESNGMATLYVSNVLDGSVAATPNVVNNGTVVRIALTDPTGDGSNGAPSVTGMMVIGSGFAQRTDPAALVIGVTGVGLANNGTLYVADTLNNRIAAISNAASRTTSAGTGQTVSSDGALNGPLGLVIAPNGDVLTVNSGDGNIVETTPSGNQVAVTMLDDTGDPAGAGALFGLAVRPNGSAAVYFVDDASNQLNLLS